MSGSSGRRRWMYAFFYERFNHLITEAEYDERPFYPFVGRTYIEAPGARISGIEYQYRYRGNGREIWWSHAIPRISSEPVCDPGQTCYADTIPTSSWSLTWMEQFSHDWSIAATLFGVNAAQYLNDSERTDSYRTLDARVAKKFRSGNMTWEAALAVTDIGPGYETFNDNRTRVPFNHVARQTMLTLRSSWF
jgi:iron complex outermembrane receptor protein